SALGALSVTSTPTATTTAALLLAAPFPALGRSFTPGRSHGGRFFRDILFVFDHLVDEIFVVFFLDQIAHQPGMARDDLARLWQTAGRGLEFLQLEIGRDERRIGLHPDRHGVA